MTLFPALVLVPVPGPEPRRDFVGVPGLIFFLGGGQGLLHYSTDLVSAAVRPTEQSME